MSDKTEDQSYEEQRRQFLKNIANLGATTAAVTLLLAHPRQSLASPYSDANFDAGGGNGTEGGDPGNSPNTPAATVDND